jgi:hypothetical protein
MSAAASPALSSRARFDHEGFFLSPPIIPRDLIERVAPRIEAVLAGEYETGVAPYKRYWDPGDPPERFRRVLEANWCDRTIRELVTHPALGRLVGELTGARWVRYWGSQTMHKPPTPADELVGNVGWHQDDQYWSTYLQGTVLTAWVAISDVTVGSGPLLFVRGSHHWGACPGGDFYRGDLEAIRLGMQPRGAREWEEVAAVLAPGAVSVHHRLTIHGSGPNRSQLPRISIAVHFFTDQALPVAGAPADKVGGLADPEKCPVVYTAP